MKRIALLFIFSASTVLGALVSTINGNVHLRWNYDAEPASTNLAFNIYWSPDITVDASNWPLLTNILSTDALNTNNWVGTNYCTNYSVDVAIVPGHYFFVATSSNFWGESSITSNVICTPRAPQPINTLKIEKAP